jgi:hypothetical protein
MFWQILPHYLEVDSHEERWKQPDFKNGAPASEFIAYFERQGDTGRAEEIRQIVGFAKWTPVNFVLAPPWVAAYVTPVDSKAIYYNLQTLGTGADHEHIVVHEKTHLSQQAAWGTMDLPGFSEIPQSTLALISAELWTAFVIDERALLEWLTENVATTKTRFDKRCSYNQFEVPLAKRLNDLVQDITGVSIVTSFKKLNDPIEFRNALLWTANYLLLENTAERLVGRPLDSSQQKILRSLWQNALRKSHIVSAQESEDFLRNSPVGSISVQSETLSKVRDIGIPLDDVFLVHASRKTEVNFLGEELVQKRDGTWRVRSSTAEAVVGILSESADEPEALELPS